jgi:hypothetical protein
VDQREGWESDRVVSRWVFMGKSLANGVSGESDTSCRGVLGNFGGGDDAKCCHGLSLLVRVFMWLVGFLLGRMFDKHHKKPTV